MCKGSCAIYRIGLYEKRSEKFTYKEKELLSIKTCFVMK